LESQVQDTPLQGLRVLDLTRLLPGGFATLILADLGADVVKVEEPGRGDYIRWSAPVVGDLSASHIALNRNKRSMTLNLKSDEGRRLFLALVLRFDVVVESFRPGVMERLGLGSSMVREVNPRLVYCAITGYGQDGPRAREAGHDINYVGYGGLLSIMGEEGSRPVVPGVQIGDLAGGGMSAVIAILAALVRRSVTGRGDFCDVSITDGAVSWLSVHAAHFVATGLVPQRGLMPLSGAYPCYRIYPAADGWITVGALEPPFWAALCAAIQRPDLTGDAYATGERRSEVVAELEAVFSRRPRSEWLHVFKGFDACVGPVYDLAEALEDPQLRHRSMFVEEPVPGAGSWTHVGNPIRLTGASGDMLRLPPPALGEHTAEILDEIGVGETDRLRSANVI
jgi:crotonobetainyl-CoA:carnitine CoA-transferase CaiB-like acyl-CoA transferase